MQSKALLKNLFCSMICPFLGGYVLEKVQNSEARKLNFCAWARLLKFQESEIWNANILFEISTVLFNYFVQTSEVCK